MNYRRRRRNRYYTRRRRRNWWPWIVFVAVAALFFWAVFQFFMVLFSNVRSEQISAELNVEKGRAEFLLPENTDWSPAFSEQKFLEGDSIRTAKGSQAEIRFLDNNQIFLDSNTEIKIVELTQKSSGKTNAIFTVESGQVWAQINDDNFNTEADSSLIVETDRTKTYVQGTTFNLLHQPDKDIVTLVDGSVTIDVLNDNDKSESIEVGVGQAATITDESYDLLVRGGNVVNAVETTFKDSDWYLDNLARNNPEQAGALRDKLTPPVSEVASGSNSKAFFNSLEVDTDLTSPVITTPVQGERISADVDLIPIKGTAPTEAFQIQVNDYVLQRFEPGDRKWTYIAATEYGTLKPGTNTYEVVAITRNGKRSEIAKIDVFYEGSATPKLTTPSTINTSISAPTAISAPAATSTVTTTATTAPDTSTDSTEATTTETPVVAAPAPTPSATLSAPVVNRPALFAADPTATYETSASVVTFSGKVSAGTQAVEVNNFRLKKFLPGDTDFTYIANATYGNMKAGENVYKIVAFDEAGNTTQTQIKIFYRPVEIE